MDVEAKLQQLKLSLPNPPIAAGNYLPYRRAGDLLYISGVISARDGQMTYTGQVGRDQTIESGYAAATICALNTLANIKAATGSLNEVEEFVFMSGYVNAVSGFDASPKVINGASDLFVELYGERGKHARAALAVNGLPANATVELQVTVRLRNTGE